MSLIFSQLKFTRTSQPPSISPFHVSHLLLHSHMLISLHSLTTVLFLFYICAVLNHSFHLSGEDCRDEEREGEGECERVCISVMRMGSQWWEEKSIIPSNWCGSCRYDHVFRSCLPFVIVSPGWHTDTLDSVITSHLPGLALSLGYCLCCQRVCVDFLWAL